ncbi:MAG: 6,7-dimethyl-8-ribityllumazine synthase [Planctomycetes bacterium]|nr:6,7-dimethyl-8-ribityllumazine synthase [Planctomycetota bacterium]
MGKTFEGKLEAKGKKFALVVSRFNSFITERLVEGAIDCIVRHGADEKDIDIVRVPGAFELPQATKMVVRKGKYDAVVALGAVIRGSTPHFDYVSAEASKGIAHVAMDADIPVSFGVLTCDTIEQAVERAGTKAGNKGSDAAMTAIEMINLFSAIGK